MDWLKDTLYFRLNEIQFSILDNNKGFINLRFLQKLNWMKTEWDQARFSSPVYQSAFAGEPSTLSLGDSFSKLPLGFSTVAFIALD